MNRALWSWGLVFPLMTTVPHLAAQQPEITFGGQVRPRMESRTPVDHSRETFTSMRVRVQLEALLASDVKVFIQFQDVRFLGEEGNTLGDYKADAFDLHQGYVEMASVPRIGGSLRVGRQALALGEQRLVGSVEWTQQGRSFDGLRYTAAAAGTVKLDLFAMQLQEKSSGTHDFDGDFLGAYGSIDMEHAGVVDLYALLTRDSREDGTHEQTFGGLWRGGTGPVDLRFEGSLQRGERNGADVSAYMVGARAEVEVHDGATVTLWYDYLSGDDDPSDDEVGVFSTLFATNHAFYGAADYFLNIPAHTGGLGLKDAAVKFTFDAGPKTGVRVDLHNIQTAKKGTLSTQSLANELDLTLTHRLSAGLTMVGGYSFVQANDGMEELGRLSENANWAFLMLNAVF